MPSHTAQDALVFPCVRVKSAEKEIQTDQVAEEVSDGSDELVALDGVCVLEARQVSC